MIEAVAFKAIAVPRAEAGGAAAVGWDVLEAGECDELDALLTSQEASAPAVRLTIAIWTATCRRQSLVNFFTGS